jgi:hypothetical protein
MYNINSTYTGEENMRPSRSPLVSLLLVFVLVSLSCNLPAGLQSEKTGTPTVALNATNIAGTVIAEIGAKTAAAQTQTAQNPPTLTPKPPETATPVFTSTPTQRPCNQAAFVTDVTIPDGTEIPAGTTFTKTWRLQNNGSCTWTSGYLAVFDSGDRMNAPDAVPVTGGTVPNGGTADITMTLKAPDTAGTYKGYFRLRAPEGTLFGLGGGVPFYVVIKAVKQATEAPAVEAKPDLVITSLQFAPYPPVKGAAVTVTVQTMNKGGAASGPYTVYWYPGENYPAPGCTWDVDGSNAGGGRVLTCLYPGYPSAYSGIVTKAEIDPSDVISEINEGNNTLKKSIDVSN